jgi:YesN/AraC family two-component response regulator
MVSSSTKQDFAQLAEELGSTGFLPKPFSKADFDTALAEIHQRLTKGILTF